MPKLGVELKVRFITDPGVIYLALIGEPAVTAISVDSAVPPSIVITW